MTRLKKIADQKGEELLRERNINLETADIALEEIGKSIDDLHEAYLNCFMD